MFVRFCLMALLMFLPISAVAQEAPLEKAAKLLLDVGEKVKIFSQLAKYWKIPGDTDKMYGKQVWVVPDKWSLVARQRPGSSRIDLLIVEMRSVVKSNYFLTSQDGLLDSAIVKEEGKNERPLPAKEAEAKFQEILKIMKDWEQNYKK